MVCWEKTQLLWEIIILPVVGLSEVKPMGWVLWRLRFRSPRTLSEAFSILKGLHGECVPQDITLWDVITFFFLVKKMYWLGNVACFIATQMPSCLETYNPLGSHNSTIVTSCTVKKKNKKITFEEKKGT